MSKPDIGQAADALGVLDSTALTMAVVLATPRVHPIRLSTGQVLVTWPDGVHGLVPHRYTAARLYRAYTEGWLIRELLLMSLASAGRARRELAAAPVGGSA